MSVVELDSLPSFSISFSEEALARLFWRVVVRICLRRLRAVHGSDDSVVAVMMACVLELYSNNMF